MRIVSLIASSTEILCALGLRDSIVGRSHECDFPKNIEELPICTETKFSPDGTSYEIDQRVKAILQEGLSVYRVKADSLNKLKPDLIVTQTQCEVCAVSLRDVEEAVCELIESQPKIVSLHPNALEDLWKDIRQVAQATGTENKGEALIENLQGETAAVSKKAKQIGKTPTVACIEWIDPLMAAGNWVPELVELAGGKNLFGVAGKHSPWMQWEEVLAKDPDIILVLPCGFSIERTLTEMHLLENKPGWKELKAVKTGNVFVLDGNQYFNRPGPRLVDSLKILTEVIHPNVFPPVVQNPFTLTVIGTDTPWVKFLS